MSVAYPAHLRGIFSSGFVAEHTRHFRQVPKGAMGKEGFMPENQKPEFTEEQLKEIANQLYRSFGSMCPSCAHQKVCKLTETPGEPYGVPCREFLNSGNHKKENFNMEDYAIGSLKDGATKKTDNGESPAVENVKKMMDAGLFSSDSKSELPWALLLLMLVFGGPKPSGGSEYWRGKYEALKEVYDKEQKTEE